MSNKYHKPYLTNKIMSDEELDNWCSVHVPGFRGCVDQCNFNELYKNMIAGESCIINLDPNYKTGGSHWVALRISSEAPLVYYKDSFGAPPPNDVILSIEKTKPLRGLIYGNRINQKLAQVNCGARSAKFLFGMSKHAKKGDEIEYFQSIES